MNELLRDLLKKNNTTVYAQHCQGCRLEKKAEWVGRREEWLGKVRELL